MSCYVIAISIPRKHGLYYIDIALTCREAHDIVEDLSLSGLSKRYLKIIEFNHLYGTTFINANDSSLIAIQQRTASELNKIENRTGLDLTILKDCNYVYYKNKHGKIRIHKALINIGTRKLLICIWRVVIKRLKFEDYGKNWALTKEELEK